MANPILNEKFYQDGQENVINNQVMTINGTIQTTAFLGIILVISAAIVWFKYTSGMTDMAIILTGAGWLVGFVLALIISFTRNKYLVPVYAGFEGLAIGGLSVIMETQFPGIVIQAVAGTFATLFVMLALYSAGVIKCTDKFRAVIFTATLSIAGIYLIDIIGRFFGFHVPIINDYTTAGFVASVIICGIAALNLIIDFDFIEKAAAMRLPKDYEWYGAFGLMVTIVWLYVEILKLLAKSRRR